MNKVNLKYFFLGVVIVLAVAGIGFLVYVKYFSATGFDLELAKQSCTREKDEYGECEDPSLLKFNCDYFVEPSDHLAELEPSLPMLVCKKTALVKDGSREGVYQVKGWGWSLSDLYITDYLVVQKGKLKLVDSKESFQKIFAPVETQEEAFAFIEAFNMGNLVFDTKNLTSMDDSSESESVSHSSSPFRLSNKGSYKVEKSSIKPTQATQTDEGFIVNVYTDYGLCDDEVYMKKLLVKTNGEIVELESVLIWESDIKPSCVA